MRVYASRSVVYAPTSFGRSRCYNDNCCYCCSFWYVYVKSRAFARAKHLEWLRDNVIKIKHLTRRATPTVIMKTPSRIMFFKCIRSTNSSTRRPSKKPLCVVKHLHLIFLTGKSLYYVGGDRIGSSRPYTRFGGSETRGKSPVSRRVLFTRAVYI